MKRHSEEELPEFFSVLITASVETQRLTLSPGAREYVVSVVSDLSSVSHSLAPKSLYVIDLLRQGLQSEGYVRREYLQIAGDVSLFVSGIFPDSLETRRNLFTLGDYIDMGRTAYSNIQIGVFDELSAKFPQVVEVLNDVSREIDLLSYDVERYIRRRRIIDDRISRR